MAVTVEKIFDKAQISAIYHNKLLSKLFDLYNKIGLHEFQKTFVLCLRYAIANGDKGPVIRVLDFVGKFCALLESKKAKSPSENDDNDNEKDDTEGKLEEDEEPMNVFVSDMFKDLLKVHSAKNQNMRLRVCYCIKKILQCLGPEASIDSDICEEIYGAMLERLKDRSPSVRAQAVTALERLQDPTDPDCPVVKAFLFHLCKDPSAEVRRAVLVCLGRSKQSLPHIRNRINDVSDNVRKQAYLSLSKVTVKSHSIKNRELILSQGLKDWSDAVRNSVEKVLLPNWLEFCQGNFVDFLHVLDVENSEIAEKALKVLLSQQSKESLINALNLNCDKLMPFDKLTVESAFFWRCVAEFLQSEEDGLWELVLPELSLYCEYVKRNLNKLKEDNKQEKLEPWDHTQSDFIVQQLLLSMKVFDLGDETGRENLKQLLIEMLISSDLRLKVIPTIMDVLVKVVPDVDTRLQIVTETISEIHEPLVGEYEQEADEDEMPAEEKRELDFKLAQLRVQRNILEEDLEIAVLERRFLMAEEMKNNLAKITEEISALSVHPRKDKIPEKNRTEDPGILSKCLTIAYEMMQSPTVKTLNPQLRSLLDNFVKNSLKVEHAVVQVIALQCLAVFSLLDESIAKEVIVVFCLYLGSTCDEIAQIAVKGIFDLLLMYGLKTFAIREEDGDVLDENVSPRKKLKKTLMRKSTFIEEDGDENDFESDDNVSKVVEETTEEVETKEYHLLSLLTKHLDSSQGPVLCSVAEGLSKLLLAMRISSPRLLSRLILLWFNPVHDDEPYLRQILGQFFKTYATMCPVSQETLERCFIPTINALYNAPCSSPLSQVDLVVVAKFLLDLTKSGVNRYSSEVNIHNNLALLVCNEIMIGNYDQAMPEIINILCHMRLALDGDIMRHLQKTLNRVKEEYSDKNSTKAIQKFQNILTTLSETGRRPSEASATEITASENADVTQVSSRFSAKRSSCVVSDDSSLRREVSSNRNKALRTESDSMIPSSSDLVGVIPETSESDNDSVFENGEE